VEKYWVCEETAVVKDEVREDVEVFELNADLHNRVT
jgi:hypothetical protein